MSVASSLAPLPRSECGCSGPNALQCDNGLVTSHVEALPTAQTLLGSVEFIVDVGRWPAGTKGTLVETFPREGFVEIVGVDGHTRAIVTVPYTALRMREVV